MNMLLTGNVAAGAEAKLRHYGLWEFFGAGARSAWRARIARQLREERASWPPSTAGTVPGPTPSAWW